MEVNRKVYNEDLVNCSELSDLEYEAQIPKITSDNGDSAYHVLALKGFEKILEHEDLGSLLNKDGDSPLHFFAIKGCKAALKHKQFNTVKNRAGMTPL